MGAELHTEDLDFFKEAKQSFEGNERFETYVNREETLIALRYGPDRDCIKVYKLDGLGEIAFLHNVMGRAPKLSVDKTKGLREDLLKPLRDSYTLGGPHQQLIEEVTKNIVLTLKTHGIEK